MALSDPRTLPAELKVFGTAFDIIWANTAPFRDRAGGGAVVDTQSFHPWRATWTAPRRYKKDEILDLKTWFDTMYGGAFTLLAHDHARPYPRTYPNGFAGMNRAGGGSFDGTGDVTTIAAKTIALATMPANFAFVRGDYVSLVQSGRYSLHRVVEAVTCNGSGVGTIEVVPPIQTNLFTALAVPNFALPLAKFVVDPNSWRGDPNADRDGVSFQARSRL